MSFSDPKVQGNVERLERHVLQAHGAAERYDDVPRTFDGLREWLHDRDIEGLVFHHPDGRMAKIKLRDFGLKRGGPSKPASTEAPDDPAKASNPKRRMIFAYALLWEFQQRASEAT